jgi:hypothetical protein
MKLGERYGKLVVTEPAGSTPSRIKLWLCQCDCGNAKVVRTDHLRTGHTVSCGCARHCNAEANMTLIEITAQQIAWERAREKPNKQDLVDAEALVKRIQEKRKLLGLHFIADVDDLIKSPE